MRNLVGILLAVFGVLGALSSRAAAQTENICADGDPADAQDVFACMSTSPLLREPGKRNCRELATLYAKVRHDAVVQRNFKPGQVMDMGTGDPSRGPSCEVFAQAVALYDGQRPYWADCIGADGTDPAQVKSCLATFIPGYHGGTKKVEDLKSCAEISREFQIAAQAATREAASGIPIASCEAIAASFTPAPAQQAKSPQWAKCFDYDPANLEPHIRQCVDLTSLEQAALMGARNFDCATIRQAYEIGLQNAYGAMPPNYRGMPCEAVAGMVADFESRKQAMLREKAEREAAAREAAARQAAARRAHGNGSGASGFDLGDLFSLGGLAVSGGPSVFSDPMGWFSRMIGFNPPRIWMGFWVQLLITIGAWVYAWRQQQRGKWWVPKGVIFDKVFYARFKLANATFILTLIFFLGYGLWFAVGAVIAAAITRFAEPIIADLGFFKTQEAASGIVEEQKAKAAAAPAPKGADIQSKEDW